ncbi:hypothetical protein CEXT_161861 [Caerostris extrusa]|uniref:Uncharacterized protein n=1 Tax=Caerostris extrusa TaxID=172846 RepID=A0AAV4VUC4_CAEEX|nr:hypothetical protein CEXT_161861 [Caerostris extrusa]
MIMTGRQSLVPFFSYPLSRITGVPGFNHPSIPRPGFSILNHPLYDPTTASPVFFLVSLSLFFSFTCFSWIPSEEKCVPRLSSPSLRCLPPLFTCIFSSTPPPLRSDS